MTNYNTAHINAFCSDEDNFRVVEAGTAEWNAIRAKDAKKAAAKAGRIAKAKEAAANPFTVGQSVRSANLIPQARGYVEGEIVAIDGGMCKVRGLRTFMVSFDTLVAA